MVNVVNLKLSEVRKRRGKNDYSSDRAGTARGREKTL